MFVPMGSSKFYVAFKDKLNGHINVFYYLYAVIKYTLQKQNIPDKKHNKILILVLTIIFSPVLFLTILIFRIYRFIIYILLLLIHGSKLHSMLDGTDAVFIMGEQNTASQMIVLTLMLVDHPGSGEEFLKKAKEDIMRIFAKDKLKKMHLTRNSFMGYYYYKNGDDVREECIKTFLQDDITSVELQTYISQFANEELPLGNTALWDIYIGLRRVKDKNAYPLIFRFHHCLCDANAVFNIFGREFTKRANDNCGTREMVLRPRPVMPKSLKESFVRSLIVDVPDRNVLCDEKISGNKLLVWFTDDSSRYIDLVKTIKKKRGGGTFVDVMLTAVSASLYSYARKKSPLLPKTMNAVITIMPTYNKPYKYGDVEMYKLQNKFTIGLVNMPLKTDLYDEDEDLRRRLKMIGEEYDIVKNKAVDVMLNRWQGRVLFTALPTPIMGPIFRRGKPTLLFSNIPGCDHLDIFDGCPVKEFMIFDPNVAVSGTSVMITTYENRLNIAFTFDKTIVPNVQDGEEICRNVIRTLDRLDSIL